MAITDDNLLTEEIAGYCRISVDLELDKDNTSIENQKSIIEDYARKHFPNAKLTFFVDRDRSGYTFDQREEYQKLRQKMINGEIKILLVKDFSRFSRRNSRGLCELEDLRDLGVRIISIGDAIDFPGSDEWLQIQFRFLINELPVTDSSKKIKAVVKRRQEEGKWLSAVPYGYRIKNIKKQEIEIVPDEAAVIREIFELYIAGWGYKKIGNYLTDKNIPTPRMKEKMRIEERGDDYKRKIVYPHWSIPTVSGIIQNDYYIGTLRQHKYTRNKINGDDVLVDPSENIVFENHHEAIIDDKTWYIAQNLLAQRTADSTYYRGIKINDHTYSGLLFCGDCNSRFIGINVKNMAHRYICKNYHLHGLKGCTSHSTRADLLDHIIKQYVKKIRDNSTDMIESWKDAIKIESTEITENENTLELLESYLKDTKEELKAIQKRKIKELTKLELQLDTNPSISHKIKIMEDTYIELEDEMTLKISGLKNQIASTSNKRNDIIKVNRLARTVIDVFDDIINKPKLDKNDLLLIVEKITIYTDHIDIQLKADVDMLLNRLPQSETVDFDSFRHGNEVILDPDTFPCALDILEGTDTTSLLLRMHLRNHPESLLVTNVVNSGWDSFNFIVLLISFGITTRPRSSILRTIPVALIIFSSIYMLFLSFLWS